MKVIEQKFEIERNLIEEFGKLDEAINKVLIQHGKNLKRGKFIKSYLGYNPSKNCYELMIVYINKK
jgi:hypothetical protein